MEKSEFEKLFKEKQREYLNEYADKYNGMRQMSDFESAERARSLLAVARSRDVDPPKLDNTILLLLEE